MKPETKKFITFEILPQQIGSPIERIRAQGACEIEDSIPVAGALGSVIGRLAALDASCDDGAPLSRGRAALLLARMIRRMAEGFWAGAGFGEDSTLVQEEGFYSAEEEEGDE